MVEIDPELVERAVRWCAEAGRQATPALAKAALSPLSWDQLLAVRALLSDPPPARPLGPFALADIARGAPADVAAERERGGRYRAAAADGEADAAEKPAVSTPRASTAARGRKRSRPPFVVRRASERKGSPEPAPPALPLFDELMLPEGRAVLERLVRRHGGRRARILEALKAAWRRPDGAALGDADLDRALTHHGMELVFQLRERDELLHSLRAAGGVLAKVAATLGLERAALEAAIDRLGARTEAERMREQRRRELRARGTLTQRTHLLLDETERLADLGLLEEFSRDLAARLPDHVRALTASSPVPALELLCLSLSLDEKGVERLSQHTGLALTSIAPRVSSRGAPPTARSDRRPPAAPGARMGPPRPRGTEARIGRPDSRTGDRRPPGGSRPAPAGRRPAGGDRRPPAGGRRPPTGDRRPPTGDRRPPTGDRRPPTGGRRPPTGDRRPPTGDRRPPTGDRRPPTGDRRPPTGGRRPPTGGRRPAPGDRRGGSRPPKRS